MTGHYERHARKIVRDFLDLLEPAARDCLPREHLAELELMIESAISASVLGQLEAVADQISDLAVEVRRRAERWQD